MSEENYDDTVLDDKDLFKLLVSVGDEISASLDEGYEKHNRG